MHILVLTPSPHRSSSSSQLFWKIGDIASSIIRVVVCVFIYQLYKHVTMHKKQLISKKPNKYIQVTGASIFHCYYPCVLYYTTLQMLLNNSITNVIMWTGSTDCRHTFKSGNNNGSSINFYSNQHKFRNFLHAKTCWCSCSNNDKMI